MMQQQQVPQGGQPVMMMQGQPGMMPQQQMMAPSVNVQVDPRAHTLATCQDGFQKLMMVKGIFVKQKIDLLEALSGCELPNKYYVSELMADQVVGMTKETDGYYSKALGLNIFKAKELSGCFERQFCRGERRPLDIELRHEGPMDMYKKGGIQGSNHGLPFLKMEKPCKPFITPCFCRPEMIVRHVGNGPNGPENRRIGKIVLPCQFMSPQLDVYWNQNKIPEEQMTGDEEVLIYTITADCCQLGLCLPECFCEACQTVTFEITQPGSEGEPIGILEKRTKGCAAAMLTDADNFLVTFPSQASNAESRALLMAAVLFCDFMFFEDTKGQNKNQHGGFH